MPRGRRRANCGRKKGSENKRPRMLAIDAVHPWDLARQYTEVSLNTLDEVARTSRSDTARVSASTALLDREFDKSTVQVDVSARSLVHVAFRSEAELRQALIDRGFPERLFSDNATP
jgi:hypothetical protein